MVARRPGSRPNPGGLPCSTVEGESLVLKFRNWVPAQWIAPRMTPSYLFMAEECMEGPSGVEVLRETSSQKRRVEITALGFVFRSTGSSNPAAISSAPFPVQLHPFGRHKLKAN
jgi:hypothetical protein